MSHVESDEDTGPLLFCERPDWTDVTPIPQYEGVSNPIAPIFYTPEYKDATDYFRGIVKTGETSERVLELTEEIIKMNPAHYSAWQYRYRTLLALNAPLHSELRLMDDFAVNNMKTYQVWHHRRLLITHLTAGSVPAADPFDTAQAELEFIARVLDVDTKNYHTWSYRQWLLAHFDDPALWLGELPYVDDLLQEDVRNNSAWHHRYFVVFGRGSRAQATPAEGAEVSQRETRYVKGKIALAPNNASAWNYLRGILEFAKTPFSSQAEFAQPYTVRRAPWDDDDVIDLDNPKPSSDADLPSVSAMDFLAEAYGRDGGESVTKAVDLWKALANQHDTMRKKYWDFRIKEALEMKKD
ncbi:protein prenyltransferase [Phanerochaete sordida]|uniref:Protein farnesyltransferase/geranylgeranyltransferase type-1 subunit alpha n=1 Tax=Phanerochaete sordida TaxID=48140 RepID=A0A9P3FZP2_9APHY|nr:protein prenyltransferase [Phanerochaete sordida]